VPSHTSQNTNHASSRAFARITPINCHATVISDDKQITRKTRRVDFSVRYTLLCAKFQNSNGMMTTISLPLPAKTHRKIKTIKNSFKTCYGLYAKMYRETA